MRPEHGAVLSAIGAFRAYEKVERFAHVADLEELAANDFNLNISRYVDTTEPIDVPSVEEALAQLREAEQRRDEAAARMDKLLAELGYARERCNRPRSQDRWLQDDHWLSDRPVGEWWGVTTNAEGRVEVLDLRHNQLSGEIPHVLGNLSELSELCLSGNQLSGTIPPQLGDLAQLTEGCSLTAALDNSSVADVPLALPVE